MHMHSICRQGPTRGLASGTFIS